MHTPGPGLHEAGSPWKRTFPKDMPRIQQFCGGAERRGLDSARAVEAWVGSSKLANLQGWPVCRYPLRTLQLLEIFIPPRITLNRDLSFPTQQINYNRIRREPSEKSAYVVAEGFENLVVAWLPSYPVLLSHGRYFPGRRQKCRPLHGKSGLLW